MRDPTEHPSEPMGMNEALSAPQRATFGHDAQRCSKTGRPYEQGSGALSHERQSLVFAAEIVKGGRLSEFEAQLLFAQAEKKTP